MWAHGGGLGGLALEKNNVQVWRNSEAGAADPTGCGSPDRIAVPVGFTPRAMLGQAGVETVVQAAGRSRC